MIRFVNAVRRSAGGFGAAYLGDSNAIAAAHAFAETTDERGASRVRDGDRKLRFARRASLSLCAMLLTAAAASAQAQDKDSIQLRDGTVETGRIKSEEYNGLAFDPPKGGTKTLEWSTIAPNGITYGGSLEYTSAIEAFEARKFEEALTKFEELKGDTKLRPVLKQNALYYIAVTLQREGKYDQAIAAYRELVTAFPKSRYLMEIGENVVASYMSKKEKDFAGASKSLDELSAATLAAGVDSGFNSSINVLKGRLMEEQGKFAEAKAAYSVAEKAAGVPAAVSQKARLGQARCLVALNNKPEAESTFRKLTGEDAPNVVLSGAWNGIGDLLQEEGRSKRDTEKLLDAVYAYLRGVVQYAPIPGESTAEYQRAMLGAASCFKAISELETNAERKRLYAERARERMEQYNKEFPKPGESAKNG